MTTPDTLDEILSYVDQQPSLARVVSAAKRLTGRAGYTTSASRIAILRNFTVEPGLPASIKVEAARLGIDCEVYLAAFDDVASEVFQPTSLLYAGTPNIVVLALRLHTLAPRLVHNFAGLSAAEVEHLKTTVVKRMHSFIDALRQNTAASVLVHNFERPIRPAFGMLDRKMTDGQISTIDAINAEVAAMAAHFGAYVVDVDSELSYVGYDRGLDDRFWHLARSPYTLPLQMRLSRIYAQYMAALLGKSKKCLVLDCDNTLWGGVVGEDGIGGIKLGSASPGSAFVEFQSAILDLYNRGFLLALCSKNNERDALDVFENHPETILRWSHFVSKRINWDDKASNIEKIARELNIGLDSLVFIDDSPVECQLVRERLPEVATVELPRDPSSYTRLLRDLPYFETLALSAEDKSRSLSYLAETKRSELRSASQSMDDFLSSLQMKISISNVDLSSIPRVAQLTQKTNQFNLTTKRYSENEIANMASDPACSVLMVELSDIFDNLGIIAVGIAIRNGQTTCIDSLLMSCRAIGRRVEDALLYALLVDAKAHGSQSIVGEYRRSEKNGQVAELYPRHNFKQDLVHPDLWNFSLEAPFAPFPKQFANKTLRLKTLTNE